MYYELRVLNSIERLWELSFLVNSLFKVRFHGAELGGEVLLESDDD